jgi:salicylate hydroxylase
MNKSRVLVAGAGIGGLTAAACMLKAGYDVDIYEQAPELGEVGAGIQLSANPMHVLNHLGLGEKIEASGVGPKAYVFRLHDTGEIIQQFPLSDHHRAMHGVSYNQVLRTDLHDLLAECVRSQKPDAIHLNCQVTGFKETSDGVVLDFADGTSAEGDILVGADGIKSAVRQQLVGDISAEYTGDIAWRFTVPASEMPNGYMDQVMSVWMGPHRHAVVYYVGGGKVLNFVGIVETDDISEESWTIHYPWEQLKADFAGWHDDIQNLIDRADRQKCYRWSLHIRPKIDQWSSDRVTMLGDAVHATLPYLAQGAAMAIEDAAVLTRALDQEADIGQALALYQRNRIDRTTRIVEESSANRTLFHMRSVEEMKAAFANRKIGAERDRWLYSYNPMTVPLL